MVRYIWNLLIALDQLLNTILNGQPDETLSSKMGKHIIKNDSLISKFI
jgi:hypothetical protein